MPRTSQYLNEYLATTSLGKLYTPGTFLAYRLRGKAKSYTRGYKQALLRALKLVGAVPVRSCHGNVAYVKKLS